MQLARLKDRYWMEHRDEFHPIVYDTITYIPTVKRKIDNKIFELEKKQEIRTKFLIFVL